MKTAEQNARTLARMLSELQDVTATAAMRTEGYEVIMQIDNVETWQLMGDTPEDICKDAQDLYDEYFLTEDDIMALTDPEDCESVSILSRASEAILDTVRAWAAQLD